MARPHFELGMAYRRRHVLYLAVGEHELLTAKRGVFASIRPYHRYSTARWVAVNDLLRAWGVTLEELDRQMARWFAPRPDGIKPHRQRAEALGALFRCGLNVEEDGDE